MLAAETKVRFQRLVTSLNALEVNTIKYKLIELD